MKFIRKDIMKLALPILTEQVFVISMGTINTMMAGHIGKEAVSAIGMVDSLNFIFISFFSALAVGGTVVVAQFVGQGNIKKANAAMKQALYSGFLISFLVTIITWTLRVPIINGLFGSADSLVIKNTILYLGITLLTYPLISIDLVANGILRGAGDTKTPMMITIFMNFINIIFSYLFIYGINIHNEHFNIVLQGMGIKGAALGIALARTIGAIIILFVLLRGSRIIKLTKILKFKLDKELLKPIFNVGIPASLESLLFNLGKLITQIFIVSMGTVTIASNAISGSIAGMINIPGNAFSIAATAIVGQLMGRRKFKEAENSLRYLVFFSSVCLGIIGLLTAPFAKSICSLYSTNIDVINLSAKLMVINAVFVLFWPFSFVLPSGFKGAGDVKYTLATSIIGMWVFRITLGYLLGISLKLGLVGVWLGMYTDWLVRGALYYIRLKNGKWKNHSVIENT
ncbi:MATE family efflux transporter [Candidatus Clostridium radicumherbarum]|uniref:Probable multidrug resistance protein NorM n=1 Tax=Candidatus Clostridium radicumherbarum TaxID=3381662 RepID=A0ABW8TMZ1_9CLOT